MLNAKSRMQQPEATYSHTGQRLVRVRTPIQKATPRPSGITAQRPALATTADLVAAWQASADAAKSLRRFGAKPTESDTAKSLAELRDAGEALIARVRQSYADAIQ